VEIIRALLEHSEQKELLSSKSNKIYYGFKEKERLTESFFVENPNTTLQEGHRILYAVSHESCIDRYIFEKISECGKNFEGIFFNNLKMLKFIIGLLKHALEVNPSELLTSVRSSLKNFNINSSSSIFKFQVINLLTIASYVKPLEVDIFSTVLDALLVCDNETSVKKNSRSPSKSKKSEHDIDFFMKIIIVHIKNQLKGLPKKPRINKDVFINHYIRCLYDSELGAFRDKPSREKNEQLIFNIIDVFCQKIIKIDRPNCIQFLVLFVANLDVKLRSKPNFDGVNSYFLHTLIQQIYSKQNQNYVKEKILLYVYSYVKSCKLSSHFIYTIIYYLEQFLRIISKRIVNKIKNEYSQVKSFDDFLTLDERSQSALLAIFNNSLFIKLIYFISMILNENLEELSTENTIDIINIFEAYFNKFMPYLKIIIKFNAKARDIFFNLNKFLNNPMINDLNENACMFSRTTESPVKRPILMRSHSNISKSSWSKCSFDSFTSVYNNEASSVCSWSFQTDFLPFKKLTHSFFTDHIRKYFKDCELYPGLKDCGKDTENSLNFSQLPSKKNSFHDNEMEFPAPRKSIKQW